VGGAQENIEKISAVPSGPGGKTTYLKKERGERKIKRMTTP